MSLLLSRFLEKKRADHPAIVDAAGAHTYAAIVNEARAIGHTLLAGRRSLEGERVGILVGPGAAFVAAFFGILLAGGSVVVLSPIHPPPESRYFCDDAALTTVLHDDEHATLLAAIAGVTGRPLRALSVAEVPPADATAFADLPEEAPALQLYTSGTTGKPKGAVITHDNLGRQQALVAEAWGFEPSDTLLHALPLHHMHGLAIALLTALGAGATTRTMAFDAVRVWDAMADATVFMGVPSMYHRLFAAFDAADAATRIRWSASAKALRLATSGSAALPVTLAERWRALTGSIPLERFGMTEIGVGISNRLAGPRFPGCVGFPLPTVEARIVDEAGNDAGDGPGELWIRGPSVFAGYHGKPDATRDAFVGGWFKTGDTVLRDRAASPEGPFRILGRTSVDILKSGGYKLSALEIEEVLREHPAVSEVAVVGVPDEAWGDRVVACVVRRPGASCDGADLRAFAKERLAPYKVPKDVTFAESLPKNALGKVVKPELTRRLTENPRNS